jgi:hypothetical protein
MAAPTESLPPAPIFVAPTPITNPKSKIQMMMEAMANMSKEFKNAITDLNVKVSNIQQGIIPSSQPHADYGDFTIDENSNWVGADDPLLDQVNPDSRMTDLELQEDAEDHFAIKLYQCLVETEVITPGTFHPSSYSAPHDKFSTFFRRLCKTHSWLLTEFPSSEQLPIVAHTWSAHILECDNKETLWAARNLFGQLSHPIKHYADHPTEFQTHFHKYIEFCKWVEHTPSQELPEALYPSFRKFKPPPPTKPKQVRFTSQPPITTLPRFDRIDRPGSRCLSPPWQNDSGLVRQESARQ